MTSTSDIVKRFVNDILPPTFTRQSTHNIKNELMSKTASARFYRSSKKRVLFQQGVVQFN